MPNGKLHSPIWTPYAVYARVDYVYGFPAWEEKDGFPAAQSSMNLIETAVYFAYLWAVAKYGTESRSVEGRGWYGMSWWGRARVMKGREAGVAVLLGLVGSLMTASKTMLYGMYRLLLVADAATHPRDRKHSFFESASEIINHLDTQALFG